MVINKNYLKKFYYFWMEIMQNITSVFGIWNSPQKNFSGALLSNKSKKQPLRINSFDKYVYLYVYVYTHTQSLVKINWWKKILFVTV